MNIKSRILYKVFQRMSKGCYGPDSGDVSTWQETFLQREMAHQKTTYYGRKYGFASIRSIEDYQRQVPLTKFDDYQPYFERLKQGATDLLFNDRIIAWLLTSGTTSVPKMVP
ncbi:MAG: GH3 auxin-responsive promoter family protein, partial [Candidatus Hodarchaeota archaeon]